MSNLVIGSKPGVGPVLKIMKDEADDPFTTPNTNYGKFLFNSDVQKVGYIGKILKIEPDFTTYPASGGTSTHPNLYLYPSGSTISNCKAIIYSWNNGGYSYQVWCLCKEFFGKDYFPLVEVRTPSATSPIEFLGPRVDAATGNVTSRGSVASFPAFSAMTQYTGYWNGSVWQVKPTVQCYVSNRPASKNPYVLVSVYDLPDWDVAIPDNSGTPTSGQEVIRIDAASGGMCRIALPGKTVADSDPESYILHEDKIPAKVLRSGEIDVAVGGTATIPIALPLTAFTYMDFHVKRQADTEWWHPPYFVGQSESQSLSFTYYVDTDDNEIVITNTSGVALTIRYAICGASETGFTGGGSKILWKGNDGSRDFIQIKRPGSSDTTPSLDDIMVDTRLSYLPILAEGFLAYPGDFPNAYVSGQRNRGERWATVNFDNHDGLLPLVKVGAIFEGTGVLQDPWLSNYDPLSIWNLHEVRITSDPTWAGRASGGSVWANIKATSVDFYSGGTNPRWLVGVDIRSYPSTMLGLRYYIFGLPQSL